MVGADEVEPCGGCDSDSMIRTPSWPQSGESPAAKEQEGPSLAATDSLSGAQRVKKVSSSKRE